jgi:hypothetical protein
MGQSKRPKARIDGYMTGMLGLYLTAVELIKRGYIVSPTSRSAMGADLLVTDKFCTRAWSVQVKTNSSNSKSWLLNKDAKQIRSRSHVYVFVTAPRNSKEPIFYVVPSIVVAQAFKKFVRPHSTFYAFERQEKYRENWKAFGKVLG